MQEGEWVTVPTYSKIMGITRSRVYQKIHNGKLRSISVADLAKNEPAVYRKIGREERCCMYVWLAEDDTGGHRHAAYTSGKEDSYKEENKTRHD